MQTQFLAAINQICAEKNLSQNKILDAVKAALKAAYRKDYGNREQNLEIILDENTGGATVFLLREVVKKEDFDNKYAQILVEDANQIKKNAKVGDILKTDVTPMDYGRIAAQSAKQVIIQKIQEAEREMVYDTYKDRENELIAARIHRVEGDTVFLQLDKTIAILEKEDQIPGEKYYQGQHTMVYLEKVVQTPKGPQLLISRTHPNLVRALLELEIPEIKNGIVKIKSIAREPGIRSKIALFSNDPKVDPIGACVGQKGVRIQGVMEELNGEHIDVLKYDEDMEKFLTTALAPAKIGYIKLDNKKKRAGVFVNEDQRALAIGKNGQNVRLASELTNWEIDILTIEEKTALEAATKKAAEAAIIKKEKKVIEKIKTGEEKTEKNAVESEEKKLGELANLTPDILKKLENAGFVSIDQIADLPLEALMAIPEITKEEAEKIKEALKA